MFVAVILYLLRVTVKNHETLCLGIRRLARGTSGARNGGVDLSITTSRPPAVNN